MRPAFTAWEEARRIAADATGMPQELAMSFLWTTPPTDRALDGWRGWQAPPRRRRHARLPVPR
jgi:hypothetical protein